jgi:hypothetical protein
MSRIRGHLTYANVIATLAVFLVLGAATAVAYAQPATPPTLSGESFHQDAPTFTALTCTQAESGVTFEAAGTASGPYPGTFHETGSALVTYDQTGHVTSYDLTMSFTIDSPVGRVTGTKHSDNFGISCGGLGVSCSGVADCNRALEDGAGAAFNTGIFGFRQGDAYQARITTADGSFADHGLFRAVFYRELSSPLNGFDESFLSGLEAPVPLVPTSKDQCKKGGWPQFGFKNQGQCIRFVKHGPKK